MIRDDNTKTLLKMAKEGKPRPNKSAKGHEGYLARAMVNYLNPKHLDYQPCLKERLILAGATGWFPDWKAKYEENRQILLKMAKEGKERPNMNSSDVQEAYLGERLSAYCVRSGNSFRPGLKEELIEAGANWFSDVKYEGEKAALLALAREGKPRPNRRSKDKTEANLGHRLSDFLSVKSSRYRPGLRQELIEAGAGSWFEPKPQKKSAIIKRRRVKY